MTYLLENMAKFLPEDKESGLAFAKQKDKVVCIYITFPECIFIFHIAAFNIYFIHKYIVSPVRLLMPNQYLAG